MWDLLGTVLLHTAVDVTESGSGQHVGRLLVDQGVKVSLDLEKRGIEKEWLNIQQSVRPEAALWTKWYLWLIENRCAIVNETSTGALVVLDYKRRAKNRG